MAEVGLHARVAAPVGTTMVVLRDGEPLYDTTDAEFHLAVGTVPGVYRIEAYLPGMQRPADVPWLVSNPIYVGLRAAHDAALAAAQRPRAAFFEPLSFADVLLESAPGSANALAPAADGGRVWTYRLPDDTGAYAALRWPVNGLALRDRMDLRASARAPMRVWVQARTSQAGFEERWGQTVFLDETERTYELHFDEFEPIGETRTPRPRREDLQALLLAVDWVNAKPGSSGEVTIAEVRLGAP
ncbi:MAG: hypothetical protein R2712_11765 [Vicinamibacterales bacterium]